MRPPKLLLSAPPSAGSNAIAPTHDSSGYATAANRASNPWGPFGNAATYGADMALAVGILLSAFVLGVLLMVGVRLYLRRRRAARTPPACVAPEKPAHAAGEERQEEPATVYSAGKTELAGAAAECAICLTEFAEGDSLRVLPSCRHGFHVECVERWLVSSSRGSSRPSARRAAPPSCPVCRASCLPPKTSPEPGP